MHEFEPAVPEKQGLVADTTNNYRDLSLESNLSTSLGGIYDCSMSTNISENERKHENVISDTFLYALDDILRDPNDTLGSAPPSLMKAITQTYSLDNSVTELKCVAQTKDNNKSKTRDKTGKQKTTRQKTGLLATHQKMKFCVLNCVPVQNQ